ncbi:MAG: T9SS type A sorting domain-containing protein [Bacteroidia bacterium]
MKKILLTILIGMVISTSLKAQIPNSGFENWTSKGSYSNPNFWSTMNDATAWSKTYTATQETPGNPGSSYLKLVSDSVGNKVVNGIAVSGKIDTTTLEPISGFPFNGRPKSLTGKYQHMIFGNSQGCVCVILTKWNTTTKKREVIAEVNDTLVDMDMSWTNFSTDLIYKSKNTPDSCIIVLKSSGINPTKYDYLSVDDLAFAGTVSGINSVGKYVSTISTYPNPARNLIVVESTIPKWSPVVIQLLDLSGRVIKEIDAGEMKGVYKTVINTDDVLRGTYFIKVVTRDVVEVKKVIFQ